MAQLRNELAETELIRQFRHDNSWLSDLTPKPKWVNNNIIKIPRQGADPQVLINNTVYPIVTNNHQDDYITVQLYKYDTTNESVTDDELYALPYEKTNEVQQKHRIVLEEKTSAHALYSIAVPADTATTPVLVTTGPDDGTGRRRLTSKDLIALWKKLADLKVPLTGRVIVLSTEHAADLFIEDEARAKTWGAEWAMGNVPAYHPSGFKLWVATYSPRYALVSTTWTRQAFEAVTGRAASVVFYKPNAVKAPGTAKRYALAAEQNPVNRENVIGFRLYFVAVGIKDEGFAAIVSADVS